MRRTLLLNLSAIAIGTLISLFAAELILRFQNFVQLDNFSNQSPWNEVFHHGSSEFVIGEYGTSCKGETIKLLLLGDSWMEDGYYLSTTIGKEIANKSNKCVLAINGSSSSYAPTVYLLRARQAFKTYGKFDYIIVNIDETDIGDEWLRYRIPTVRDTSGKIVAVPYEHDIASQYKWKGKLWAENSNLYIIRLIKFAYYYKILIPSIYKFTVTPDIYSNLMQYVFAPDAVSLYQREHQHFENRITEMVSEISNFTTATKSVYLTHHPHLRGLISTIDNGKLYLPVMSEIIARQNEKSGVSVLDARNNIIKIHGESFPNNTFVEGDPFSHLERDGAIRYGEWIVDRIDLK